MTFDEANDLLHSKRRLVKLGPAIAACSRRGSPRISEAWTPGPSVLRVPRRSCRRSARPPGLMGDGGTLTVDWRGTVMLDSCGAKSLAELVDDR